MAGPSSLKTLNSIHLFSIKPPSPPSSSSSPSSLSSMKLKTILQTFIFSHMYGIARALSKAKSVLIHLLKDIHFIHFLHLIKNKNNNKHKKLFFGSFRLHYNWCSSHHAAPYSSSHVLHCNSSVVPTTTLFDFDEMQDSMELSRYLQWLEEKGDQESINEIDKLADLFIANCHEKFRLEKQESYRRFQEMMARSM